MCSVCKKPTSVTWTDVSFVKVNNKGFCFCRTKRVRQNKTPGQERNACQNMKQKLRTSPYILHFYDSIGHFYPRVTRNLTSGSLATELLSVTWTLRHPLICKATRPSAGSRPEIPCWDIWHSVVRLLFRSRCRSFAVGLAHCNLHLFWVLKQNHWRTTLLT